MATYNFTITAHIFKDDINTDAMTIYSRDSHTRPYPESLRPIWCKCKELVSCALWQLDDDDDNADTDYCQYVAYTDPATNNYLLATFTKIDEHTK